MTLDPYWTEALAAVQTLIADRGRLSVALPSQLHAGITGAVPYGVPADAVLLHKGQLHLFPVDSLEDIAGMTPIFHNDVFVLYVRGKKTSTPSWFRRGPFAALVPRASRSPVEPYLKDIASGRFSGSQTVFLHIPKTAGSAIYKAAAGKFERPLQLPSSAQLLDVSDHLPARDFIAGHFTFDAAQTVLRNARYTTLVRDPLDRLVSATGHARRAGENVSRLPPDMRLLRTERLKDYLGRPTGRAELFVQNWIIAGRREPVPAALLDERLERISVGTVDAMAAFVERNRTLLRITPAEIERVNVTPERGTLVPQEEIDEALAAHGDLIDEARELIRLVQRQERRSHS